MINKNGFRHVQSGLWLLLRNHTEFESAILWERHFLQHLKHHFYPLLAKQATFRVAECVGKEETILVIGSLVDLLPAPTGCRLILEYPIDIPGVEFVQVHPNDKLKIRGDGIALVDEGEQTRRTLQEKS